MQKVVWVRDLGHRAALLRIVCFAWVPGAFHPPCPTPPPLPFPLSLSLSFSLSLSLAGPYAQNLRLISSSAGQPALRTYRWPYVSLYFVGSRSWEVTVWEVQRVCDILEVQGWRWRACSVTPSPLIVIAVEWPDRTASSAPRPSTVSDCTDRVFYCWTLCKT